MIKQMTIILSCALLGIGLSCTNSDNTGGVGQTCRSITGRFDNMFFCSETTQCTEEELQRGAKPGKCAAISTNCTKQDIYTNGRSNCYELHMYRNTS